MRNKHHRELLSRIIENAGEPTQHTFQDNYLGNNHPRYPINVPTLRKIGKEWMKAHQKISCKEFAALLGSLVKGKSSTEKCFAGILLNYSTLEQRQFDPRLFMGWLDYVEGWAEVDSLCTGHYSATQIPIDWHHWKPVLSQLAKSKNINKRRASIVLLCSCLRTSTDSRLAYFALKNIDRLKNEKEILITKAISWTLRSMQKHHKKILSGYIDNNRDTLPKIAVRETLMKLKTGSKNKKKTTKS